MRLILAVGLVVLTLFFMVFAWQNQEAAVTVAFGTWESTNLPVFLVVLLSFGAGVVLTSIIGIAEGMRVRMTNAKLRNKIKKLETEVDALRNLPLTGTTAPADPVSSDGEDADDVL